MKKVNRYSCFWHFLIKEILVINWLCFYPRNVCRQWMELMNRMVTGCFSGFSWRTNNAYVQAICSSDCFVRTVSFEGKWTGTHPQVTISGMNPSWASFLDWIWRTYHTLDSGIIYEYIYMIDLSALNYWCIYGVHLPHNSI